MQTIEQQKAVQDIADANKALLQHHQVKAALYIREKAIKLGQSYEDIANNIGNHLREDFEKISIEWGSIIFAIPLVVSLIASRTIAG